MFTHKYLYAVSPVILDVTDLCVVARGTGAAPDSTEASTSATRSRPRLLQGATRGDQTHREGVQAQVSESENWSD